MIRPDGEGYRIDRFQTDFSGVGPARSGWHGTVQRNIVGERCRTAKEPGQGGATDKEAS
jgi:hypothetical protein